MHKEESVHVKSSMPNILSIIGLKLALMAMGAKKKKNPGHRNANGYKDGGREEERSFEQLCALKEGLEMSFLYKAESHLA